MRKSLRWFLGLGFCMAAAGCSAAKNQGNKPVEPSNLILGLPLEVDVSPIDPEPLLGAVAERVMSEGASELHVVATGAAAEGDRVGGFVQVKPDMCLVSYARGSKGVEDLDILVFDDEGASLMADQTLGAAPGVVLCPPHAERMYLLARVASGQGVIALGAHAVKPERAQAVAIHLGARMTQEEGRGPQQSAWPGLEERVERRRSDLGGKWLELGRAARPVSQRAPTYVSTSLPAATCLDVMVIPNEEVRGLQVNLQDEQGMVIGRAIEQGEDRVALVCSPVDTTISVEVRPLRGHGMAAVVLSRSEAGTEKELAALPDARRVGSMLPLPELAQRTEAALGPHYSVKKKLVGRGPLQIGATVSHRHRLAAGCTRLDILAGAPLTSVRASLWSSDILWSRAEGGEQATVFGCTDRPTDVEVEVEGQGGPGQHLVEARWAAEASPQLLANPVAAARLLGRLNAGANVVLPSMLQDVRDVEVNQDSRHTLPYSIAQGTCQTMVVALNPLASGVTLWLKEGQEIVERGHGGEVASVRRCAQDRPLRGEAHVTVSAGQSRALVGILNR